jgi:hypothetical protein
MKRKLYKLFKWFFQDYIDEEISKHVRDRTNELHESYQFAKRMDRLISQRKNTPTG